MVVIYVHQNKMFGKMNSNKTTSLKMHIVTGVKTILRERNVAVNSLIRRIFNVWCVPLSVKLNVHISKKEVECCYAYKGGVVFVEILG